MPASLYELPGIRDGSVLLVPGDIHFGACDLPVYYLMLQAAEEARVTHCVLLGDTFEAGGLSTHPKEAAKQANGELLISREIGEAKVPLQDLRALVECMGGAVAIPGNHEARVERFVSENPAWHGTMSWDTVYKEAFGRGWSLLPGGVFVKAGPLAIFHGHTLTGMKFGGGKTPAKTVLDNYPGQNTMFGHTHRRDTYTRPTWKNGIKIQHGSWNVGHLADESKSGWANDQAWEQSFALVHFFSDRDGHLVFSVDLARVLRDSRNRPTVLVGGRAYR
jgi:hypothetical protein